MALSDRNRKRGRVVAALLVAAAFGVVARPAAAADPLPSLSTLLAVEDPAASDAPDLARPAGTAQTAAVAPEDESPVYTKWWFWAITGAVVVGTVGLVVWASQPTDTPAKPCSAGTLVCFGEGR
jgi:hypothetical protein